MPKVRCTEPHRKQILRKLRAKSLSPSADYLPKMRFKDAFYYEVLWKLRFDFKEIDASEKQDSRIKKGRYGVSYWSFAPQLPQNLVLDGFFALHFGQLISSDFNGDPQLPQNFIVAGTSAPHFGHFTLATGTRLVPQFPQNLVPTGFWAPQL